MKRFTSLAACALLAVSACVTPETMARTCAGVAVGQRLLVLEGDLRATSGLGVVGADGCLTEVAGGLALGGDTAIAASRGQALVLDRDEGIVHRVDPEALQIVESLRAYRDGEPRSNPQDAAVDAAGRRWVTRFDRPSLAVLGEGGTLTEIDLGAHADADGIPEAAAIHMEGDVAHVALQKLDAEAANAIYPPTGPGVVLSIPAEDPSAMHAVDLVGQNPFGRFSAAPWDAGLLAIATPGVFDAISPDDGVDLVDTVAGEARQIVAEDALGGSATEAILAGPTEAYAIAAGPEAGVNPTRVVAFDPETGKVTRVLAEAAGYYHWGLALAGDHVAVGDRTPGRARIVFFDRKTGTQVAEIPTQRLAPLSIVPAP